MDDIANIAKGDATKQSIRKPKPKVKESTIPEELYDDEHPDVPPLM